MRLSREKNLIPAQVQHASLRSTHEAPASVSTLSSLSSQARVRVASRRLARLRHRLSRDGSLLLMTLPGMLLLFIFSYLPMIGIVIAFKDYRAVDGIWGSRWVGLENFRYL